MLLLGRAGWGESNNTALKARGEKLTEGNEGKLRLSTVRDQNADEVPAVFGSMTSMERARRKELQTKGPKKKAGQNHAILEQSNSRSRGYSRSGK